MEPVVVYTANVIIKRKTVLNREVNIIGHLHKRSTFFLTVFTGSLGDLVMHVVLALLVVHCCEVLLFKKGVCH